MSEFSQLLSDAVAASGFTQAEVERRTGIDRTVLSRLMSGAIAPSSANLSALLKKFRPEANVGHALIFAHLRDQAAAAGLAADAVVVRLRDAANARDSLPVGLSADLDLLALEALENEDFASLITDWAAVVRRHHLALEGRVYPFPGEATASAVAEPPASPPKPERRARPAAPIPRPDSQRIEPPA